MKILAVALSVIVFASCSVTRQPTPIRWVTYEVTGKETIGAALTYTNENGSTEQRTAGVPWTKRFPVKTGQFLYLSAQNASEGGTITVQINIDGIPAKTATSFGEAAIASASYRCCE